VIEEEKISQFASFIIDEAHIIAEEGRGLILESIITKLLYIQELMTIKLKKP